MRGDRSRERSEPGPPRRSTTGTLLLALFLLVALALLDALAANAFADEAREDSRSASATTTPARTTAPDELERLLRTPFRIVDVEPIDEGRTGAMRMEIFHPVDARRLVVKWKAAPQGGDGWNRSPRREIAAYEIQKWFLEAEDHVVPPTVAVCIPLEVYATVDPTPEPNLPGGAGCVFGTLVVWLDDVRTPDPLFDPARFEREPRYATHLARYNLLTHLIDNRDTRAGNQLVSADDDDRRVYSVDNGIAFGEWLYNPFRSHWNVIRVPALPRGAIERLRRVEDDAFAALAVVAELRADDRGVYRDAPASAPIDPDVGLRLEDGVLQLGLTSTEIAGVRRRVRDLLAAVDGAEIAVFGEAPGDRPSP